MAPQPTRLVAATSSTESHPYGSLALFERYFGRVHDAGLPVFVGEFAPTAYMSMTNIQALLAYTRQRGIGWAAWVFEPDGNPPLVDSSLNPTTPFGITVRTEMITTPTVASCS